MPRVAANGIEVCYEETGAGVPLVLIMGIGAQLVTWDDAFVDELAGRGFRVIRFDNRDAGLSTKLDPRRAPPLSEMIADRVLGRRIRTVDDDEQLEIRVGLRQHARDGAADELGPSARGDDAGDEAHGASSPCGRRPARRSSPIAR